jgi:lysophospholipase L1-like esterase
VKCVWAGISVLILVLCVCGPVSADPTTSWVGTWATSPTGLPTESRSGTYVYPAKRAFTGTVRYRVRVSLAGHAIRLTLSNEYGDKPLAVAAASVGVAANDLDAVPGSIRPATFNGQRDIRIPVGAPVLTDPVDMPVKYGSDLIVSIYVSQPTWLVTCTADYPLSNQTAIASKDETLKVKAPAGHCLGTLRPLVSRVDVLAESGAKVLVTLGDSITDGSVDAVTGERGWPGALARRVREKHIAVVNAGISGNRLLESMSIAGNSALARLEQDVFSVPGLTHIAVLEGTNDIGLSGKGGMLGDSPLVRSEDLIAAYTQIIARAHERGVKVVCATIAPFEGIAYPGYYSEDKELVRERFNDWVRTAEKCDGKVDFDRVLRANDHPRRLRADVDSGDHLHPNSKGHREMAEAFDVHLLD